MHNRQWHKFRRFLIGKTKHHALVAGTGFRGLVVDSRRRSTDRLTPMAISSDCSSIEVMTAQASIKSRFMPDVDFSTVLRTLAMST